MRYPTLASKTVLITGCSSGIGRAASRVLREKGWDVVPSARKEKDVESLGEEGFNAVQLDLADSGSIEKAVKTTLEISGGLLGGLVNNAGFGQPGALEDLSRDAMRNQFEVNVIGMQELTNRCIPVFRNQGYGRIVHISSVVGRLALPFMGIYSASKFAMEALGDSLRVELYGSGVAVSLVEPGPIETAFVDNAGQQARDNLDFEHSSFGEIYEKEVLNRKRGDKATDMFALPPESVARKIDHALRSRRPRTRYPVTVPAYLGVLLQRFAPDRVVDALMLSRMKSRLPER